MTPLDRTIAPPISNFGHLEVPQLRISTLDNGIPLHVLDQGSEDVCRISMIWDGGQVEAKSPSLPDLAFNLMREGAAGHTGEEIADILEFNGAWLKGGADSHNTRLDLYSLNARLEPVLHLVSDMIADPSMPTHEWEVIRQKAAGRLDVLNSKVEHQAAVAVNKLVMGSRHRLARNETSDDLGGITREAMLEWHHRIFTPATCGIYLSGRITPAIEDMVNRIFGMVSASSQRPMALNLEPFSPEYGAKKFIEMPGALQSGVSIAIPTIGREHPDYIMLRLAVIALGGYFGSRLMANIREDKGYTYGIRASQLGYREGGIAIVSSSTANCHVDRLIDETMGEINRMGAGDYTASEINRLQRYATSVLASTLDSPFSIMDYYQTMRLSLTPIDYFQQQLAAIASITPDTLAEVSRRHLRTSIAAVAVAGDK